MAIFPDWLIGLVTNKPLTAEEIEVQQVEHELFLEEALDAYAGINVTDGVICQTMEAEAYVQQWVIAPDNIYIVNQSNDLEPWFLTLLNNEINTGDLANEVSDLIAQFENFEDGITLQIGYLQDADQALAYDLSVLKVQNDTNTAGIQNLDITKVDAYEAAAISSSTIAAWQTDGTGGAWFDSQISAVSNVAYSAASSASTLTASLSSQQDQLIALAGDLDVLASQVDGTVETWFDTHDVVDASGNILENVEPYLSWYNVDPLLDTRAIHTGDTYVKYELDVNLNKVYLGSFRFTKTTIDEPYTDADGYAFVQLSDSTADDAYILALQALALADSKVVTWYQADPPVFLTDEDAANAEGDVWVDSDDFNTLYRYDGTVPFSITGWVEINDTRIEASVTRLDEATVDINGTATALSTLVVQAGGAISGFVAGASSDPDYEGSIFNIYADNFYVTNQAGDLSAAPFYINTDINKIVFTGSVSFYGTPVDTAIQPDTLEDAITNNVTFIDGNKIITGSIQAASIAAGAITADHIDADAITGKTITGGTIVGTTIDGASINGAIIKASYFDLLETGYLTDWEFFTEANPPPVAYWSAFARDTSGDLILHGGYYRLIKIKYATFSTSTAYYTSSMTRAEYNYNLNTYDDYFEFTGNKPAKAYPNYVVTGTSNLSGYITLVKLDSTPLNGDFRGVAGAATLHIAGNTIRAIITGYGATVSYQIIINGSTVHNGNMGLGATLTYTVGGISVKIKAIYFFLSLTSVYFNCGLQMMIANNIFIPTSGNLADGSSPMKLTDISMSSPSSYSRGYIYLYGTTYTETYTI